jgi:hypothetical protein
MLKGKMLKIARFLSIIPLMTNVVSNIYPSMKKDGTQEVVKATRKVSALRSV